MSNYSKNYLLRAKAIQDLYSEHKKDGVTTMHVFRTYIRPRFFISVSAFYNYLSVPAARELKKLETPADDRD